MRIIQSGLFLLPDSPGDMLVFPMCDNLETQRKMIPRAKGKTKLEQDE